MFCWIVKHFTVAFLICVLKFYPLFLSFTINFCFIIAFIPLMKYSEIMWFPFNLHQFRGHFRTKCAELWMWNLTSCDSLFLTGN